jgi:hypothetical protein
MPTYETNDGIQRLEIEYNLDLIAITAPSLIKELLDQTNRLQMMVPTSEHKLTDPGGAYPKTFVYKFTGVDPSKTYQSNLTFGTQTDSNPVQDIVSSGGMTREQLGSFPGIIASIIAIHNVNEIVHLELRYW